MTTSNCIQGVVSDVAGLRSIAKSMVERLSAIVMLCNPAKIKELSIRLSFRARVLLRVQIKRDSEAWSRSADRMYKPVSSMFIETWRNATRALNILLVSCFYKQV